MECCCWRTRGPFVAGCRARPGGEPARKHCVSAFGGRNRPRESARNMFLSSMLSPKEKMLKVQNTSKWGEVILNKSEKASGCVVARRVPGGRGTVPSRRPPLTNARLGHAAYLCFFGRQRGRRGCRGLEKPPTAPGRSCSSACDSLQLPVDSRLDTWSRFSKINKNIHHNFTYVAICAVRRSSSVTNHFHPVTCADHTWQTSDTVSHLSALKAVELAMWGDVLDSFLSDTHTQSLRTPRVQTRCTPPGLALLRAPVTCCLAFLSPPFPCPHAQGLEQFV